MTVFNYRDRKPLKISDLRDIGRAFAREREKLYGYYAEKRLALPTEGDLVPPMPLFLEREGRRHENWFGLKHTAKEWRVSTAAPLSSPGDTLFEISRKFIPNYYWFLFGALCLLMVRLAGPIDTRIPLLTAVALIGLLVTLFGSVQWEFRYPFDPLFTVFALHAAYTPCVWLTRSQLGQGFARLSGVRKTLVAGLRRLKLAR